MLQEYRIPFVGLKLGTHQFNYKIDSRFFDEFEYSLVKTGEVSIDMELTKQETMLILQFTGKGSIYLTCDRCVSEFPSVINIDERQIVKFTEDENLEDNTDEVIVLSKNEHEINVAPLIYEYINLAVPYFNRCDEPGMTEWCDKEMLDKLEKLSGSSAEETEQNSVADPRWEALKKIK
ncbi:uncharacterized metal-binding protein YceD (DUF177 family) [Arcticibacter pallidicorallinus]|uniref:Uncharacterized metal-binding protein YceD (DUF177 family) n=1 Tax=Arcticibacter pallidicorallinus TaxID=1259464 RepID=A0A2T0U8Z6_9SPHI|nr:uncharacterized metal-binding protein YceD (DUF177 family) [Arcticibacter pallidicorallinus]